MTRLKSLILLGLACAVSSAIADTYYVRTNGYDTSNGTSWATAFATVSNAIATAGANDDIWVAEGTYTPGTSRTNSFELKQDLGLYGGFTNGMTLFNQRNWTNYPTVLSGDIQQDGENTNNSYHIVTSSNITGAVIDGFTITRGYADASGGGGKSWILDSGGGMLNRNGSTVTVNNCMFIDNFADYAGGGMMNYSYCSPVLSNCTFIGNPAYAFYITYAAGMCNRNFSSPTLTDCLFLTNCSRSHATMFNYGDCSPVLVNCVFKKGRAWDNIGGICNHTRSYARFINCSFIENYGVRNGYYGGAMLNVVDSSPYLSNCTFIANESKSWGAAMYNSSRSSPVLIDCSFTSNSTVNRDVSKGYSGGAMYCTGGSSPVLSNCTFYGNSSRLYGGAIHLNGTSCPTFYNCSFTSNTASDGGGAIYSMNLSAPILKNCRFVRNAVTNGGVYGGGAMCNNDSSPSIINCTFTTNTANNFGGAIDNHSNSCPVVKNCIVWGNAAASDKEVRNSSGSTPTNSYSDMEGCGGSGPGWDSAFGEDGGGNIDYEPLFVDVSSDDLHLKSCQGTWNGSGWTKYRGQQSSCIDAGDTGDLVGDEPEPNGGVINMGAYGGTWEASKTLFSGTFIYLR